MTDLGNFTGTNKARAIAVAKKKMYTLTDLCAVMAALVFVAASVFLGGIL